MSDSPYTHEVDATIVDYKPHVPGSGENFDALESDDLIGMPGAMMTRRQRDEYLAAARPGGYFGMGGGQRQRQTQRHRRYRKVLKPFRSLSRSRYRSRSRSRSHRSGRRAVVH